MRIHILISRDKIKTYLLFGIFSIALTILGYHLQEKEHNYTDYTLVNTTQKQNIVNANQEVYHEEPQNINQSNETDSKYININTAGIDELDKLYGIGIKMAERIIDYRNTHGKFEVPEDIMRVSGIGKKTFEKIKDNICVK